MKENEKNKNDFFFGLTSLPETPVTAMAYVPFQTDRSTFDDDTAFCKGTLFTDLNKPFRRGAVK